MSETVNMHEAKTHFSKLVDRAMAGEDIVVAKAGKPCVRLVRVDEPPLVPRTPGRFRGLLGDIPDSVWFEPSFTDEEVDQFEGAGLFPDEPDE